MVKNLPPMQQAKVRSLGQEDPLGREWQSTPIFLLGEFHGQRSLVGYSSWGRRVRHNLVTEQQQQSKSSGHLRANENVRSQSNHLYSG